MGTALKLDLIGHGITEALRAARFPADEPLTEGGRNALPAYTPPSDAAVRTGPELRAVQTAERLGLSGAPDPRLRDLDAGHWRGAALDTLPPADLQHWLTDPSWAGHGGESVLDVLARTAEWLADVAAEGTPTVAITHPAVVRSALVIALDAPPAAFWRLDVAPGGVARLRHRGRWTVRIG
ncbi:MAG TPA: histidine phosphatase family protein [Nocardia sp.]|uniref:histidine phosphatase family protein n=1 Tax=Nocardia TaxID=1817 RepID=UPI002457E63A|nr:MULTISPECIES: histidine phosphatase family protein [Nocardia]HLS77504.1 histidine phosphatase family protein [Nocardia sp.]